METVNINLRCPNCGGEAFAQPIDPKPDDEITCIACRAVRTFGDFQAIARDELLQARQNIIDAIRRKT